MGNKASTFTEDQLEAYQVSKLVNIDLKDGIERVNI